MTTLAILKSLHTLDNRQFVKGLSDSERRSRRAGQQIGRHARGMGRRFQTLTGNVVSLQGAIGLLAGSAGIGYLVNQQMKAIQSTQNLRKITGFTSSTIEAMGLQAQKYGVSQERASDALVDFSERLGEAREGTGEALDGFKLLEKATGRQLDLTDNVNEVWSDFVAGMTEVEDSSTRAAIAAQIGGDALRDMLPALSDGENGLKGAAEEARALGLAFNDVEAQQVEDANQAISSMKASFGGMARIATIELANPLRAVADSINDSLTGSQDFQQTIRDMTNSAVNGIATVIDGAANVIDFVQQNATMAQFGLLGYVLFGKRGAVVGAIAGKIIKGVELALAKLGATTTENQQAFVNLREELARAEERAEHMGMRAENTAGHMGDRFQKGFERAQAEVRRIEEELATVRENMGSDELDSMVEKFGTSEDSVNGMAAGMRQVAETMRNAVNNSGSVSGGSPNAQSGGNVPSGGGGSPADAAQQEMDKQQQRLNVIRQSFMTEMELQQAHFEREQEFLQTAHESLFESEVERKNMLLQLERNHQKRKLEIERQGMGSLYQTQMGFLGQMEKGAEASGMTQAGIMTNAFAQITSAGAQHNKKMFEMNKKAGIANAIVSSMVAFTNALRDVPYPYNLAAASMVLASGMAKVSAIKSQSYSGGGGAAPSTSAGGGVPAVQNVGAQQQQQQQGPSTVDITVRRNSRRSSWSDEEVEDMFTQISEKMGDGAKLGKLRVT